MSVPVHPGSFSLGWENGSGVHSNGALASPQNPFKFLELRALGRSVGVCRGSALRWVAAR